MSIVSENNIHHLIQHIKRITMKYFLWKQIKTQFQKGGSFQAVLDYPHPRPTPANITSNPKTDPE